MLNLPISLFANAKAVAQCSEITVGTFLDGMRDGKWHENVARVRVLASKHTAAVVAHGLDSDQAKGAKQTLNREKERLPGVTLAGRFASRAKGALPQSLTSLVPVDLDNLPNLEDARRKLEVSPHVLAVWLSCSGRGLWLLGRSAPDLTAANYSAAWAAMASHAADLLGLPRSATGTTGRPLFDPSVRNIARLCFVSHDPDLWVNPRAEPLEITAITHLQAPLCIEGELANLRGEDEGKISSEHAAPTPDACTLHSALGSAERSLLLMDADNRARERLDALPPLVRGAYLRHFDRRFDLAPGRRNLTIATAAPALLRRLSFDIALAVMMAFYDLHRELWNDSRECHEAESRAALTNGLERLVATLKGPEKLLYEKLRTEARRAAFRIARDLARTHDQGDFCAFFLSEGQLAGRIGVADVTAREILQDFARWQLIFPLERGERRKPGKKPRATRWRWNHSIEDVDVP